VSLIWKIIYRGTDKSNLFKVAAARYINSSRLTKRVILYSALFMIITNVSLSLYTPPTPNTPEQIAAIQEDGDRFNAEVQARLFVRNNLKAPSTANIGSDITTAPKRDKRGKRIKDIWESSGYVDAQNSYGVKLRQKWYVNMRKHGDSWELLNIKFW
jgi:hypothetical protein